MRDRATAYAERVVSGDVVAGELHVQACRRHLRDLERQGTDEFPYLWVPEKSEEILDFAETLTIVEGDEPRPVRLYGCQTFDLGVPMGWVNRKGYRRFRRKPKLTEREKLVITAYTGYVLEGTAGKVVDFVEQELGHSIQTPEPPAVPVVVEVRRALQEEFCEICRKHHIFDYI